LDGSRFSSLVLVCGSGLRSDSLIHSCSRGRDHSGNDSAQKSGDDPNSLVARFRLVSPSSTSLASFNRTGFERKSVAQNATRVGAYIQWLLAVLDHAGIGNRVHALDPGLSSLADLPRVGVTRNERALSS